MPVTHGDKDRPGEPGGTQWHEHPGAVFTAGLAGLIAIGVLVFAVVQTSRHSNGPSATELPSTTTTTSSSSRTTTTTSSTTETTSTEPSPTDAITTEVTTTETTPETTTSTTTTTIFNPYLTTTQGVAGYS